MFGTRRRIKQLFERPLPLAGHPALETLLERSLRKNAYRAGFRLARLLAGVAPGVDPAVLVRAFEQGVTAGSSAPDGGGRVYRFPDG